MKYYHPILTAGAACCLVFSCVNEKYIEVEEDGGKIVLNAQMTADEETHIIYLSTSHIRQVDPLEGAEVKVYVNGTFVTDAIGYEGGTVAAKYSFQAVFRTGDVVRITARKGDLSAEAVTTVPAPAAIVSIDTASVRSMFQDEMEDFLQVKVRMRDVPGESTWFRVGVYRYEEGKAVYTDEDGERRETGLGELALQLPVETDSDPIINEGGGSSSGDLMSFLSAKNRFASFSDNLFADGECVIRVNLYKSYLGDQPYFYFDGAPEYDLIGRRRLVFALYTTGFWQYHYLKALDNLDAFDYETSFLIEPTTLPSNVEGGLGFVSVDNVTSMVFVDDELATHVDHRYY